MNLVQQNVIKSLISPVTVPDAEYHPGSDEDESGSLECLPQTREKMIKDICDWLDDSNSTQKHLYWLQGKAGTGKTTIARTVVNKMAKKNRIVANFFFKRGEGDRARLKRFFITLAAQLVRKSPDFAIAVEGALGLDPSLPEQGPRAQFKKLIQEPLQNQKANSPKSIIIIVDALDECDSDEDLKTLAQLLQQPVLSDRSSAQLLIKYFLTSRFDHHTQAISKTIPNEKCENTALEKATSETMKRDIELYLRFHLKKIDGLLVPTPTEDPWSNLSNMKILIDLTEQAYPLFEFAAAACRFIARTSIPGGPRKFLDDIMKSQTPGDLGNVYEYILKRRFHKLKDQPHLTDEEQKAIRREFQKVIGSVVSLADSVDVRCLAQLTELPEQAIRQELYHFESVLVVPAEQNSRSPVRLFHESFRDFLTGPDTNEEFKVDSISAHEFLALRCRRILCDSLQENICKLESPGTDRREVADETIRNLIPLQLQYACRFWVYHIKRSQSSIKDGDDCHSFLLSHFLMWLEALSLLGRMSESASLVTDLKIASEGVKVKAFLEDAERLILCFRHVIDITPLQLYSSVLTFAPKMSVVREVFDKYRAKWISHIPDVDYQWSPCLQTLEDHTVEVSFVAFSSDGLLASSDISAKVKIWDPISGVCLQTFSPKHTSYNDEHMHSLTFLQDGKLACRTMASLHVWDIRQDICLQELYLEKHISKSKSKNHMHSINSVISTDKHKLILAGGPLLRIVTSELKDGYKEQFNPSFDDTPMILSSDGQLVASLTDREIRIFNMNSEADNSPKILENTGEFRDEEWMAYFSLDNRYFVSRQDLNVVKVWEVSSTKCVQVFRESERINALAFSRDSQFLGMGYQSGKIFIWKWETRTRLKTFTGHQDRVSSLAFSPNGTWLASASWDRTVKIWDNSASTSYEGSMTDFRERQIGMAMSGQRLVTLLLDTGNLQVWDDFGSKCIVEHPFKKEYYAVAIAANGGIVAAVVRYENAVEIWDVESNDHSIIRKFSSLYVRNCSIALSANGERFITMANNAIVEVRESRTGRSLKVKEYESSQNSVASPAISLDGEQLAWEGERSNTQARIFIDNVCTDVLRELRLPHYSRSHTDYFVSPQYYSTFRYPHSLAFSQNGERLVAVETEWTGAVWDVVTGVCLRIWNFRYENEPVGLSYDLNTGFINFDLAGSPVLEEWEDCLARYCISHNEVWILRNGKRLLWIPPEYRPPNAAASGSNIACWRTSGRPFVIGFSDDVFLTCYPLPTDK